MIFRSLPRGPIPHVIERCTHVRSCVANNAHTGVSPSLSSLSNESMLPLIAYADSAGDSRSVVDDQELAMIARHDPKPSAKTGWTEDAHLDPPFP